MANYSAPEGFLFDENTGLYYTQVIAMDENHTPSQVVTWFNAESGEYSQEVYPIPQNAMQGKTAPAAQHVTCKKNKKTAIMLSIVAVAVGCLILFLGIRFLNSRNTSLEDDMNLSAKESSSTAYTQADLSSDKDPALGLSQTSTSGVSPDIASKNTSTPTSVDVNAIFAGSETSTSTSATENVSVSEQDLLSGGYNVNYITGIFIASDINIPRAYAPAIEIRDDYTCTLWLNFSEGMEDFECTYTLSKKQDEMDDLYVYITVNQPLNGIPKTGTVLFGDSPDYCLFLEEGFGLMGYEDAPFGFYRDERE